VSDTQEEIDLDGLIADMAAGVYAVKVIKQSYEQLQKRNAELEKENQRLRGRLFQGLMEIAELKEAKDSE
jgi:prefoldin subunit 5